MQIVLLNMLFIHYSIKEHHHFLHKLKVFINSLVKDRGILWVVTQMWIVWSKKAFEPQFIHLLYTMLKIGVEDGHDMQVFVVAS